jgi:protein-tyrosine phosphatase
VGAGDSLDIASVPNLRDVGGYATRSGGTVRTGLLYRSAALDRLVGPDAETFGRLGIRTVYDLRGERERQAAPDRLPAATEYVSADVLAAWTEGGPWSLFAWFDDPRAAREGLGGGRAEAIWMEQYRHFVTLPSAQAAYGRLFRDIASEAHRPALFHCSTGKDRTGWAAAAFLLLLDVPLELVMADFRRSRAYLDPIVLPMLESLRERGGDPELWRPIFAVRPAYLEAGLDQVRRSFGSIEAYFADGLGIDRGGQEALRVAFVDRGPAGPASGERG